MTNCIHRAPRFILTTLLLSITALLPLKAQTSFPSKPVRVVLPYSAGSGVDAVVRQLGEKLSGYWGQQIVVDNKPGANGWLAIGDVKKAPSDGQTLLTVDATHMTLQPQLYKQLPFDPLKDFEPVAPLYSLNFFIVVGANSPYKNVSELVAAAKAKQGALTYGTWGIGSVGHVGTAMLEAQTGTRMTHVPFKELPQLYTAVATGEVDWAYGAASTVGGLYRAQKVKLLAYAGSKRNPSFPNVPTVAEAGGPAGFELSTWVALYAPKGTPVAIRERIQAGVVKALAEPDVRERLSGANSAFGVEPWAGSAADLSKAAALDTRRYSQIVKSAAISLD